MQRPLYKIKCYIVVEYILILLNNNLQFDDFCFTEFHVSSEDQESFGIFVRLTDAIFAIHTLQFDNSFNSY